MLVTRPEDAKQKIKNAIQAWEAAIDMIWMIKKRASTRR